MAIKKINLSIWTDRSKIELKSGGQDNGQEALAQLLAATGDRAAREKALEGLQAAHARYCEWEDKRAKETATNG